MRKAEIARRIAEATGLTQVKADEVVNAILDEIKVALQRGDAVTLRRLARLRCATKGSGWGATQKLVRRQPSWRGAWCGFRPAHR